VEDDGMRWLVERPPGSEAGQFEDVGAESFTIESGALVFRTGDQIEYVLAAGQWLTVCPGSDR
jgi:hypothetical protein